MVPHELNTDPSDESSVWGVIRAMLQIGIHDCYHYDVTIVWCRDLKLELVLVSPSICSNIDEKP